MGPLHRQLFPSIYNIEFESQAHRRWRCITVQLRKLATKAPNPMKTNNNNNNNNNVWKQLERRIENMEGERKCFGWRKRWISYKGGFKNWSKTNPISCTFSLTYQLTFDFFSKAVLPEGSAVHRSWVGGTNQKHNTTKHPTSKNKKNSRHTKTTKPPNKNPRPPLCLYQKHRNLIVLLDPKERLTRSRLKCATLSWQRSLNNSSLVVSDCWGLNWSKKYVHMLCIISMAHLNYATIFTMSLTPRKNISMFEKPLSHDSTSCLT